MVKLILDPYILLDNFNGKFVPLYNWDLSSTQEDKNFWHQVIYHRTIPKSKIKEEWAGGKVE